MDLDQTVPETPVEDVEGHDDPSSGAWGDYTLDSVFVRQESRTVSDILGRIEKGRYVLDPDFQRDFVWPEDKQSKLIESCIMRIPLPVFYVAEAKDGRIIVVDGLQRVTTFQRFVGNKFQLKGLGSEEENAPKHPLEGKTFDDLDVTLQERILDTQLIMYILDDQAPERARLDIFERVNSGVPLSRQQMRNAIYNGPATTWLRDAADSLAFRHVSGQSLSTKTMRDREVVNRFCAFYLLGWADYRGDMEGYLATALKTMNDMSEADLAQLRKRFERSLQSNRNLFDEHAFRKSLASDGAEAGRNIFNISLFEVCAVLLARLSEEATPDSEPGRKIRKALIELIGKDEFSFAITYSTNSTRSVQARFELAEKALGIPKPE